MRCVVHLACQRHSAVVEVEQDTIDATTHALRRPAVAARCTMQLILILSAGFKPGDLIGRGVRFLKSMLVRNPSVRVRFQDTPTIPKYGEVQITGLPNEAINLHFELHARLKTECIIQSLIQSQKQGEKQRQHLWECQAQELSRTNRLGTGVSRTHCEMKTGLGLVQTEEPSIWLFPAERMLLSGPQEQNTAESVPCVGAA